MIVHAIAASRVWAAGRWLDDHAVVVSNGTIAAIVPIDRLPSNASVEICDGGTLLPGFIDTQVNGGGGVLFNDQPTIDGVRAIAEAHRRYGTTALLPTLISDEFTTIRRAIAAVDEAIEQSVAGIVGIHIEGPFLNHGKSGIHDAGTFRTLDEQSVEMLVSLKNGRTLVTLAPEVAPTGMIRLLVDRGVIVAAGHTLATYEQMQSAIEEGLTGVTHLFNAMSQLESRAPGVVGAALDGPLTCGLILDGHHVHPASARAAYRAKGPDELMLVTDAMSTVGGGASQFELGGQTIFAVDGALRSASGTLAGSTLDMASAVRNCMAMMRVDLAVASQLASATPARFIGLGERYGIIAEGYRADLVVLDREWNVSRTWIGGSAD